MRTTFAIVIAAGLAAVTDVPLRAQQEPKPVPKDSARVSISGCSKGYVFTAGPRTTEQPGQLEIAEGMHFRMNGPKDMMKEIKAHEGSAIEITGLIKRGQYKEGVNIGGGVRISPGISPGGGTGASMSMGSTGGPIQIDVEGWRQAVGSCRTR